MNALKQLLTLLFGKKAKKQKHNLPADSHTGRPSSLSDLKAINNDRWTTESEFQL